MINLDNTFFTTEELAQVLKTTPKTIIREIQKGKLSAIKVGRQYRITDESFQKYLEKNTTYTPEELETFMRGD